MKSSVIITLYAVSAVVLLACIKLLLHFTLADTSTAQQDGTRMPAELMRCLVLYGQRMLIVASLSIDWPATIAYPLRALAWMWSSSSPETLSVDCVLLDSSIVPLSVQRILFYLSMPITMLLVLLVLETFLHRCCYRKRRVTAMGSTTQRLPRLGSTTMVVMFFFMPSLLRTLFGLFACIPLDQPSTWPYISNAVGLFWVYDTSSSCFGPGWHRSLALGLGVPLIAILCIGLPATIVYITLSNFSNLGDIAFRRSWGFLTQSYRPRHCYWEAVVVWETAVLVAISVFGVNVGPFFQSLIMVAALMSIALCQAHFQPFADVQAGRLMVQGTLCLLLTALVGQSCLPYGPVLPSTVYGLVMGGILLAVNALYVCSVLWQLMRVIDWAAVRSVVNNGISAVRNSLRQLGMSVRHAILRLLRLTGTGPAQTGKIASGLGAQGISPRA
jgi:hypothetical protein